MIQPNSSKLPPNHYVYTDYGVKLSLDHRQQINWHWCEARKLLDRISWKLVIRNFTDFSFIFFCWKTLKSSSFLIKRLYLNIKLSSLLKQPPALPRFWICTSISRKFYRDVANVALKWLQTFRPVLGYSLSARGFFMLWHAYGTSLPNNQHAKRRERSKLLR